MKFKVGQLVKFDPKAYGTKHFPRLPEEIKAIFSKPMKIIDVISRPGYKTHYYCRNDLGEMRLRPEWLLPLPINETSTEYED